MTSQWNENQDASEYVLRLLEQSGALLEARVSSKCQEFVGSAHNKQGVRVHSDSVTYGSDAEMNLRQIDQCVSLYKEFVLDERTGIAFNLQIPIEVKNRRNVEVFGIEYPPHSYRPRMPITASLQGSRLSSTIRDALPFENMPLLTPVFLEISDGVTPKKIFDENLSYNAANAAYDFIKFEFSPSRVGEGSDLAMGTEIIKKMRLVERLEQYLVEKRYVWWSVIHDWMRSNLTDALAAEFNRRLFRGRISYSVNAYFPILCLNGRLWQLSDSKFSECEALLTRVRVKGWPGELRQQLLHYTTEVPLLLTHPDGLAKVLLEASSWFLKVEKNVKAADKKTKQRWHLESAFYQEAVAHFMRQHPRSDIRSDLDFFEMMQILGDRG